VFIACRHGSTASNENGHEKIRGWLPIPLSKKGMEEAEEAAHNLSGVDNVEAIYCSDLVRAVQTAQEVAEALEMTITPREELRDWNQGDYSGQEAEKVYKRLHDFIESPQRKVPNGESYQFFLDRAVPFLNECAKSDKLYILVTHGRVVTLINALAKNKGEHPDTETLKGKAPVDPGGIIIVNPSWKITFMSSKRDKAAVS
jgi:broad specificity phosphatase PhoE